MRRYRSLVTCLCVLGICAVATAQIAATEPTETAPAPPPAEPVIGHIPADAAAFVVINNVQTFSEDLTAFIAAIDDSLQMPWLMMAQMLLQLGEGFNPDGGLAVVLLDPAAYGVDLFADIDSGMETETEEFVFVDGEVVTEGEDASVEVEDDTNIWPVVVFIPGTSVEAVFPAATASPGELHRVQTPLGKMVATTKGSYVVLGLRADALEAVLKVGPTLADQLSKTELADLSEAGVALHLNMKVFGPIVRQKMAELFANTQEMMAASGAPAGYNADMLDASMRMYGYLLDQLDAVTVRLKIDATGAKLGETIRFSPASDLGKVLAAYKSSPLQPLDRLPDLPYVFALASHIDYSDQIATMSKAFSDMFLHTPEGETLVPADVLKKSEEMGKQFYEQVSDVQFVFGGAPEGAGAMGVAVVLTCDDAEKLRSLMAEHMKLQQTIMEAAFPDAEGKTVWSFTHTKDAATVDGVSVDRIDIPLPGMDAGEPEVRQQIEALFGGELSMFVAAANDKTLVMTLGGGEAMMGQALKVAAGGGTIGSSKAVAAALADVPTDAMFVGVFSLKNFGAFVQTAMAELDVPDADQFPLKYMQSDTPVVLFAQTDQAALDINLVVPIEVIQDAVASVKRLEEEHEGEFDGGAGDGPFEGGDNEMPPDDTGF
ncbi:hypothetical protein LCGC14_0125180 [marine sediment metagenome]|uniref:DUF3352 domain-containing protein n=1 Tax=marine sediment metagenome TaxID=412755 RepID=A0A0F9Y7V6_9ZZZZ|nr:hypothetical protein [Phycisphaerae bacterium]HDZ44285.1 hypothetical protein [Phycisphaerae bacterium]